MADISSEEAIRRAQIEMSLPSTTLARLWRTRRLDRPGAYYLVEFGEPEAMIGIATVDVATGDVGEWSQLSGVGSNVAVDRDRALELSGCDANASVELVWKPCRATLSPLYPLWEVRTARATVYIDQHGTLWTCLEPARPGS
jgi:hypothetical protein